MSECLNCGKEVKNKYCNVTCQNEHKGKVNKEKYYLNPSLCENCGKIIEYEFKRNKFCGHSCSAIKNNKNTTRNKTGINGIISKPKKVIVIKELIQDNNKGNIFKLSKNWQSARTAIRRNACQVFAKSGKEYKCAICGYDLHVEIAHIKAVSDFDDIAILKEINNINNLVALCPTHHWEYDAGLINL